MSLQGVSWVFLFLNTPGAKGYEKAEDPIWVLENGIAIDTQFYLLSVCRERLSYFLFSLLIMYPCTRHHQLEQPLMRIFEPIMQNPQSLFNGDHTRSITVATPGARAGGLMGFVKKTITCLGCKVPLPEGGTTLCKHCMQHEDEVYLKLLNNVNEKEQLFSRLWTECQRCQGSLHQDVLCTSRDCPIFYMRKKVQKDLKDAQEMLSRFNW